MTATTNLLVAVLVSIVTNWVDIYEPIQYWQPVGGFRLEDIDAVVTSCDVQPLQSNGKYLGKLGTVLEVTRLEFDWNGKQQEHRIEKEMYQIMLHCHEKPPAPPELVWDEPIVWTNISVGTNVSIDIEQDIPIVIADEDRRRWWSITNEAHE